MATEVLEGSERIDEIYAPVFSRMQELDQQAREIAELIDQAKMTEIFQKADGLQTSLELAQAIQEEVIDIAAPDPVIEQPPPAEVPPISIDTRRPYRDSFVSRVRRNPLAAGFGLLLAGSLSLGVLMSRPQISKAAEYVQCVVGRLRVSSDTAGLSRVGNDFVINEEPPEDCAALLWPPEGQQQGAQWVVAPEVGITHPPPLPSPTEVVEVTFPAPQPTPIEPTPVVTVQAQPTAVASVVAVRPAPAPASQATPESPVVVAAPVVQPQVSAEEKNFRKFVETKVVIANPGDTFEGNLTLPAEMIEWDGPIRKKDYIGEVIRILAADNGHNLNLVHPGQEISLEGILRPDQMSKLREALSINDSHYAYQLDLR